MKGKDKNNQIITVQVLGTDYKFNVTRAAFNEFVNAMKEQSKVVPHHQFCASTICDEQKDELIDLLKCNPGSEIEIASFIVEEYKPDLGIIVKKQNSAVSS